MNRLYEEALAKALPHLDAHPGYLPHIGERYSNARAKTLIVAESHYLPEKYNSKFTVNDWYERPEYIYSIVGEDSGWFNTKGVVKHYKTGKQISGGMALFYNLEMAYASINKDIRLFDECAYINYFQRPAEKQGQSILIDKRDSKIALENLMAISKILNPDKIIFVSSKAYNDFVKNVSSEQKARLKYVDSVPHAGASAWWNKSSKKFGLNGQSVTGKAKFIRIVTPKNKI